MHDCEVFFWALTVLAGGSGCITFGMIFYLGRTKMKEVDRLIYGFETQGESFSLQAQRMMDYGAVFTWRWHAKRAERLYVYDHFDKKFKRPFIVTYYLFWVTAILMVILYILDEWFLHITP